MTLERSRVPDFKELLLNDLIHHVRSPAQYVGGEWNMVRKNPREMDLRFCLAFPDTYSIGMSCNGLHVLYGLLNEMEDVYCERAFAPWLDMQQQLHDRGLPLCSLETFTPLREFDLIGFSLQHEMTYTNLLGMLELGRVPLHSSERSGGDPLVIAGGPCASNPEPLADFVDLFLPGEAETVLPNLIRAYIALKHHSISREELLAELVRRVPSVYAPSLYRATWGTDGRLTELAPRPQFAEVAPTTIEQACVRDLAEAYVPDRPIVPFAEIVHDRISIEIMRGCTRGCRYCHAGMTRRPVRWRTPELITELAEKQYAATGYDQIALTSLSSSDYPRLTDLLRQLGSRFKDRGVTISLPSLRVNEQLRELPALLSRVRKTTLTIAPEAGTDRLRRVINKDISEEDLLRGVEAAYAQGWNQVKLYFMVGLPTETDEDIQAVARLADRVSNARREVAKGRGRVNVSVAGFVPKAHTPFELEPMASIERLRAIRARLKSEVRNRAVTIKMHSPERSFLEGVFARGDRRLGPVLLEAHRLGCRFDGWDETFDFQRWLQAFESAGVDGAFYANRRRDGSELLPWSHIRSGVSARFLARERERAAQEQLTPDCRIDRCNGCGAPLCSRRD